MGSPKTKTIGGGQATGLANDWYSFLGNTLKGTGNAPGAGAVQQTIGNQIPKPTTGNPSGGITAQLGGGTGGYNQQTMFDNNGVSSGGGGLINGQGANLGMGRPNAGNPSGGGLGAPRPINPNMQALLGGGPTGSRSDGFTPGSIDQRAVSADPAGYAEWMKGAQEQELSHPGSTMLSQNGGVSAVNTNDYSSFTGDMSSSNSPVPGAAGGRPAGGSNFLGSVVQGANQLLQNKPNVPGVGGFAGGMESLMNPDISSMIANNPFLANLMNYDPSAAGSMPNAPTWQNANYQTPGTVGASNVGYNNATAGGTDLSSFMSQFGGDAGKMLQSMGIDPSQLGNVNLSNPALNNPSGNFGYAGGSLKDFTKDPSFQAIASMADRDTMKKTADMRERFGISGNTMSSGASLAEAQLAAEGGASKIAALQGLGREIQGLDLQQQDVNNNLRTGLLRSQVQDSLGRFGISADLSKAGASLSGNNTANLMQFLTSNQGQNIGAATSIANNNAGNTTNANIANSQGGLDASKANAANSLNAGIANSNNVMDMNRLRSGDNSAMNTFNQNNYSIGSSNALNDKQMQNQFQQFLGSQGINLQQLAQTGQMGIISQLFSAFQQAAGIGTPQAQTVQTPSGLSQALNFGLGAAGTIGSIMSGNPAGAVGGVSTMAGSFNPTITPLSTPRQLYPTSGIR